EHPYTKALLDVVPEAGGLDRPILTGEPPDPTRIPEGCRFHPRCPVVESGRAAELGIETRCRADDLALQAMGQEHEAACYEAFLRHGGGAPTA
ncbi:MAG: oligopeptide/dipeptide ABC transporter ATP-binding protein, partial [Actinomycetota bacterium]